MGRESGLQKMLPFGGAPAKRVRGFQLRRPFLADFIRI
jgi:hypothetical protein